jgi:hypothetical protein
VFDRIYLKGWVPSLQVSGQVVNFLVQHLGFPIPSPAILERIGLRAGGRGCRCRGPRPTGPPVLVGHFDAPGGGLPHDRVGRTAACLQVLRHCAQTNLDIGRPEEMQIIFGRRVAAAPEGGSRTRLLRTGDEVTLNAYFRHSRVKSYLNCSRALRTEIVINDTVSVRAVSLRAQPLSGSRDDPWWTGGGPRPCGSATLGSWPWPAPCAHASTLAAGSPIGAFVPRWPCRSGSRKRLGKLQFKDFRS